MADPFVVLNQVVAKTFGSRTPVTYYPSTGPSVDQPFLINAVIDTPHDLADELNDVQKMIWIDGNDTTLPTGPVSGDHLVLSDGTIYSVHMIHYDAEKGISLICRKAS